MRHAVMLNETWRRIGRALAMVLMTAACAGGGRDGAAQDPAVSYIAVFPGARTLAPGDSLQLEAVLLDARGDTLRNVGVSWRSANPAIARITADGRVHAVSPGLAGITASVGTRVGSARVIVAPRGPVAAAAPSSGSGAHPRAAPRRDAPAAEPPAPEPRPRRDAGAAHPHEPPGFTRLAERAFRSRARADDDRGDRQCRGGSECWDGVEHRYRRFEIIEDPSAPVSCCTVARMRYGPQHRSGTAPATVQTRPFEPRVEEMYISVWARISANWHGNQSSTNKMFFTGFGANANNVFLSAEGAGSNALEPQIRLQGVPDERRRLRPNVQRVTLRRGAWQHWEFYLKLNDPGAANGIARMWVDGVLVTDVRDVRYRRPGEGHAKWWIFHWSPTYGGGGASPPAEQFLDFDHVYVSGR